MIRQDHGFDPHVEIALVAGNGLIWVAKETSSFSVRMARQITWSSLINCYFELE